MALNKALIAELTHEAVNTRKMLERVPQEHFAWKPHEKSMTLQRIASHVADLPTWVSTGIKTDELDMGAKPFTPILFNSTEEILEHFDNTLAQAIKDLEEASDELLHEKWVFRHGDHVIFNLPKAAVVRNFAMNHTVHHRGQLSVYLRLLDVPVPGMYGPSADDR